MSVCAQSRVWQYCLCRNAFPYYSLPLKGVLSQLFNSNRVYPPCIHGSVSIACKERVLTVRGYARLSTHLVLILSPRLTGLPQAPSSSLQAMYRSRPPYPPGLLESNSRQLPSGAIKGSSSTYLVLITLPRFCTSKEVTPMPAKYGTGNLPTHLLGHVCRKRRHSMRIMLHKIQ